MAELGEVQLKLELEQKEQNQKNHGKVKLSKAEEDLRFKPNLKSL